MEYCKRNNKNCFKTDTNSLICFLHEAYKRGCGHSRLGVLRAAVSAFAQVSSDNSSALTRYMKGVFNTRPPLPKYTSIWDTDKLFKFFDSQTEVTAKLLTYKAVLLLLLLSAQRKQLTTSIIIDNIKFHNEQLIILPNKLQKHNKPGRNIDPLIFKSFKMNEKFCIVKTFKDYIKFRQDIAPPSTNQLFMTIKLYKGLARPATENTISRWVIECLNLAGIDTNQFKCHSTRSASSSKAVSRGVSRADILKRGCWKINSTFAKHYSKHIIKSNIYPNETGDNLHTPI